jgi:hypothetical protein
MTADSLIVWTLISFWCKFVCCFVECEWLPCWFFFFSTLMLFQIDEAFYWFVHIGKVRLVLKVALHRRIIERKLDRPASTLLCSRVDHHNLSMES